MRPRPRAALLAALIAWALPCGAQEAATLHVEGQAGYSARVALPPDALLVTALTDTAAPVPQVLADARVVVRDAQVPLPFALDVPRGILRDGGAYTLRVAIRSGGVPVWIGPEIALDPDAESPVRLGTVELAPYDFVAFATEYDCGGEAVRFGVGPGGQARMRLRGRSVDLEGVPSASGAKYAAPGDAGTVFWSKGDSALVSLAGEELPECGKVPDPGRLVGDPWRLESLAGEDAAPPGTARTLAFAADGAVTGAAGCNRFTGRARFDGVSLGIGPLATTRMACPTARAEAEARFLEALSRVARWRLEPDGALALEGAEGAVLARFRR